MGQSEVLETLKKENRWMSSKEIAEISQASRSLVTRAIATLFKHGEIFRKKYKGARWYVYHYK